MKIAIVGAGTAGIAAGRTLQAAGHEVTLLEKSRGVGGRVHSRREGSFIFDTGATSLAPRGRAIEDVVLNQLSNDDLVSIDAPIYTHEGLRVTPGDKGRNATKRYTYRSGLQQFAKLAAADLNVQLNVSVDRLDRDGSTYVINDERYDAVILTPPIPQTTQLLWTLDESRAFANAKYRPCLSVLLGFDQPTPDVPYHALLDVSQSHPLTWLSLESKKSPGRAAEGQCAMVAQMSPRFSLEHYAKPEEFILETVLSFVKHLYGSQFDQPMVAKVKQWKYSQPDNLASFESVNRPGSTLLIASDGIQGGRIEEAYESGVKAAQLLLSSV